MAGGGSQPRPGEVSLAHNGVLFLDELPEFSRETLEVLRQPLEDGQITVSRVHGSATYPCRFMLVAAMNPCPCGYHGSRGGMPLHPHAIARYRQRISGPLLDRIDLHVEARPVEYEALAARPGANPARPSAAGWPSPRPAARPVQGRRGTLQRPAAQRAAAPVLPAGPRRRNDAAGAFDRMGYSARAYDRILRVARTVADLNGREVIDAAALMEALQYRQMDGKDKGEPSAVPCPGRPEQRRTAPAENGGGCAFTLFQFLWSRRYSRNAGVWLQY